MILLHRIAQTLRRLRANQRGNVLLLFGLSIVPLTFATGMGIDYSMAMRLQTRLNAAADAAALASTTTPMLNKTMSQACDAATKMFVLQSSNLAGLTFNTSDPSQLSIVITETYAASTTQTGTCGALTTALSGSLLTPLSRVTTITYRGQSANTFGALLGKPTLTVSGKISTKVSTAPFIDIHLALDTSQSMGLAASNADAIALYAATKLQNGATRGCTFGCHVISSQDPSRGPFTNEQLAHNAGLTLRIDTLKTATQSMIDSATLNEGASQLYRFALYRIGRSSSASATDTFSTISSLSTDLTAARRTVGNLTLGWNNSNGVGDTDLATMTTSILPNITAHGDGTSQGNARAFLFIVTDGVTDIPPASGSCTSGHCTGPISASTCDAYKNSNVTVGVVYTTYLPIYQNPSNLSNNPTTGPFDSNYSALVQPFSSSIATNLQNCASPGWFFQASDGASIHTAMQNLFSQASQTPIITH